MGRHVLRATIVKLGSVTESAVVLLRKTVLALPISIAQAKIVIFLPVKSQESASYSTKTTVRHAQRRLNALAEAVSTVDVVWRKMVRTAQARANV